MVGYLIHTRFIDFLIKRVMTPKMIDGYVDKA